MWTKPGNSPPPSSQERVLYCCCRGPSRQRGRHQQEVLAEDPHRVSLTKRIQQIEATDTDCDVWTSLHEAADGNLAAVKELLANGTEANAICAVSSEALNNAHGKGSHQKFRNAALKMSLAAYAIGCPSPFVSAHQPIL